MPANSPEHYDLIDGDAMISGAKAASIDGHDVKDNCDPQAAYAAYGKIHIKDKNLIRFESVPERICHGVGVEPSSA
jgi:hypothetical protein